jgi:predicted enzyme related to lactoylglutathione lyase
MRKTPAIPYIFAPAGRLMLCLLTLLVMLSGCTAPKPLPEGGAELARVPVTENPTGSTIPGKIIWHDLLTPDLRLSGKFYTKLFGWQISYGEHYATIRNEGKLIGGILEVEPVDNDPKARWIPTISVRDLDKAAGRLKAAGGSIQNGPLDIGKRGRALLFSDFQEADLVLLTAKGGDPGDGEVSIGDWLWDEIWTRDPESTRNFYMGVLEYDEVVTARDDYEIFKRSGKWRAGIRHTADKPVSSSWVSVIRVTDPWATAIQAKELGGAVLLSPDQAKNRGNVALLRDPLGALLIVQRWTPQDDSVEGR